MGTNIFGPQNFASNAAEAQLNGTLLGDDGGITKTGQAIARAEASKMFTSTCFNVMFTIILYICSMLVSFGFFSDPIHMSIHVGMPFVKRPALCSSPEQSWHQSCCQLPSLIQAGMS